MPVEQELQHLFTAAKRPEPCFDDRLEQVPILPAGGVGIKALVGQQFGFADILGEALPLVVQHREYNPAIASLKQSARRGARTMAPRRAGIVVTVREQILHQEDIMNM